MIVGGSFRWLRKYSTYRRGLHSDCAVPFGLLAWRFGDGDSKRYVQFAWGQWIPAYAGMTWVECGNDVGGVRE